MIFSMATWLPGGVRWCADAKNGHAVGERRARKKKGELQPAVRQSL
jgi:hypothetical protein